MKSQSAQMDRNAAGGAASREPTSLEVAVDQAQTRTSGGYLPVDLALLTAGDHRGFDLYQKTDGNMVLLCAQDFPLDGKFINRLRNEREATLYVPANQGAMLSEYAESVLQRVMLNEAIPSEHRASILHNSARTIMADILANPMAQGVVQRGVRLANATVDFIARDPASIKSMVALFTKDYYTYTHSVHTCVLGAAMYKYVISPNPAMLRRFTLGMLLDDTGKSIISRDVLNKPERLTEQEFTHMKAHAAVGWRTLEAHGMNDDLVRQAVLHHHEKLNGEGYPAGLSGREVSPPARVAGIVDVYDALTTDRPYRYALTHAEAIKLMESTMTPHHLDAEFLAAFEKIGGTFAPPEDEEEAD